MHWNANKKYVSEIKKAKHRIKNDDVKSGEKGTGGAQSPQQ
jgi:hypothetical protein